MMEVSKDLSKKIKKFCRKLTLEYPKEEFKKKAPI
jgi:hypothetical protein